MRSASRVRNKDGVDLVKSHETGGRGETAPDNPRNGAHARENVAYHAYSPAKDSISSIAISSLPLVALRARQKCWSNGRFYGLVAENSGVARGQQHRARGAIARESHESRRAK